MSLKLEELGALLLVLVAGVLFYGHWRYTAAVTKTSAKYEAMLQVANDAKVAADTRAQDERERAQRISEVTGHETQVRIDATRADRDAAYRRLHDYENDTRRLGLPEAPPGTSGAPAPAQIASCDRQDGIALDAATDGQLDAELAAQWQSWYAAQRANSVH